MADITDLAQKLAFYRSGGKDEGQRDIDKIGKIFGTVKGGIDYRDEIIKRTLAEKKLQLENTKLQRGNTPYSTLSPGLNMPSGYENLTPDEGKDTAAIQAALRKPEDVLGREDRADQRRIEAEGRAEQRRLDAEARKEARGTQSAATQRIVEGLKGQLDELDSVLQDVGALNKKFDKSLTGWTGAAANVAQHTPIIGGLIAPDTKEYKDTVGTTALNVQKVLTKTGRSVNAGLNAEAAAFPSTGDARELGANKFVEVDRKLKQRANAIINRIKTIDPSYQQPEYSINSANTNTVSKPSSGGLLQTLINKHANTP